MVAVSGGETLRLMAKRVDWQSLTPAARRAKPAFLHDPCREVSVYRSWLAAAELGTATCYGGLINDEAGCHLLLMEHVAGQELYQIGDVAVWRRVAAWLARFHIEFAGVSQDDPRADHLLRWQRGDFERWLARTTAFTAALGDDQVRRRLMAQYTRALDELLVLPTTLIHGEFFASNVLVEHKAEGLRVCPIDWELAALGPGLLDLAALVAGSWDETERAALAGSYWEAARQSTVAAAEETHFSHQLRCARLALAVQRLGWAADWTPPSEHRHDWFAEAMTLVTEMEASS